MNPSLTTLEKAMLPFFKGLPKLPGNAKKLLVDLWPLLALILGALQMVAAWGLWQAGHRTNEILQEANDLARAYGIETTDGSLGIFYWLALIFLVIDGVILLMAASPLQAKLKKGWDLLFLGAILNLAYGVAAAFDANYGGVGSLVQTLLGSALGLYVLFQVREYYGAHAQKLKTSSKDKRYN